jgi:hypothetical protein
MSFLFGSSTNQNAPQQLTSLRIQTSAYGIVRPILFGRNRVAPNLIWYGDFTATAQTQSAGKGGGGSATSYTYSASVILACTEGPINGFVSVFVGRAVLTLAESGLAVFLGTYPQSPWGYMSSAHPDQALGYQGLSLACGENVGLDSSASLANYNFEMDGMQQNVPGQVDADPADVIREFLTNVNFGAGYQSEWLSDLSLFSSYCRAAGLLLSPLFDQATDAQSQLQALVEFCNSEFVDSEGILTIVPYGDAPLSGNGATYTPPEPVWDFGPDDFLNADGEPPLRLTRPRAADAYNVCTYECLDRNDRYNPVPVSADDPASIDTYNMRPEGSQQAHFCCDTSIARQAVQLRVQRLRAQNAYEFKTFFRAHILDAMDIVTLTEPTLGLDHQPARITEIDIDDATLDVTIKCKELVQGTGSAENYPFQASSGYGSAADDLPGSINAPIIFEPPAKLVDSPQIWAAVSGGPSWGGCNVWASTDGERYKRVGTINGNAITGVLSAALASGSDPDTTDTLSVDLTQSRGQLTSFSLEDCNLFASLCFVDGEYIAFETANLTAQYKYDLTYLRRGANGSTIGAHAKNSLFARLDEMIFRHPYPQSVIGKTLYFKFTSFNLMGAHEEELSDVIAYTMGPDGRSVPRGYGFDPDHLVFWRF